DRPVAPRRLRHRRPDDPGPVGYGGPDERAHRQGELQRPGPRRLRRAAGLTAVGALDGKVVVVTGGARGQGAAEVAALARAGAVVVATDVLDDEGKALAK